MVRDAPRVVLVVAIEFAQPSFSIKIICDWTRFVTTKDPGIGMIKNEFVNNLGTIGKCGTEATCMCVDGNISMIR